MITTLAGTPVEILEGSRKSITGSKYFTVRATELPELTMRLIKFSRKAQWNIWKMRLKKTELKYDSEQELYDALKLVKN